MRRVWAIVLLALLGAPVFADDEFLILQSTTSTQNSGLLDFILPQFQAASGIEVRVVAVGTGQALRNAMNGDGDVVLVHARAAEDAFVVGGWGVERFDVMYNDFVIVGPPDDPAGIAEIKSASAALVQIAATQNIFVSRGDGSGTHSAEIALWGDTDVDVQAASGSWYRETGASMGTTLNIAVEMHGYVLTDRSTWLSFGNKRDHVILVQGDPRLFNQYGIILVNPEKYPTTKAKAGQVFIDWMLGDAGQQAIADFKVNGTQLFFPDAAPE